MAFLLLLSGLRTQSTVWMQVLSLASLRGWRIQCCHKMWLRSGLAVAVASLCSSDSSPSLGTPGCRRYSPVKKKTKTGELQIKG